VPGELERALVETGFFPFLCVGINVDGLVPLIRMAGEAHICRKLDDAAWEFLRDGVVATIDRLRSAPLDDLSTH